MFVENAPEKLFGGGGKVEGTQLAGQCLTNTSCLRNTNTNTNTIFVFVKYKQNANEKTICMQDSKGQNGENTTWLDVDNAFKQTYKFTNSPKHYWLSFPMIRTMYTILYLYLLIFTKLVEDVYSHAQK